MNPKKYMLLFFILCSLLSNAQGELRIANIASVISTGMYEYAIVHETGTSNYFKTSPATLGLLYQNRTVQIESTSDDADIVEIIDPEMDGTLFAKRIISSSDALLYYPC